MSDNRSALSEILGHQRILTPGMFDPRSELLSMFMVPAHKLEGSRDSTAKQAVTIRKWTCFIEDKPPQPKRNQTQ